MHGHVYSVVGMEGLAVKVAYAENEAYDKVKETYRFIIQHSHPILVPIFEFKEVLQQERQTFYYATMEKLYPLTEDEQKMIKSVCMDYNGNIENGKALQHIVELQEWLEFDKEKVVSFHQGLTSLPVKHRDFHRRNIMKDKNGNYKLIDFELIDIVEKNNEK